MALAEPSTATTSKNSGGKKVGYVEELYVVPSFRHRPESIIVAFLRIFNIAASWVALALEFLMGEGVNHLAHPSPSGDSLKSTI